MARDRRHYSAYPALPVQLMEIGRPGKQQPRCAASTSLHGILARRGELASILLAAVMCSTGSQAPGGCPRLTPVCRSLCADPCVVGQSEACSHGAPPSAIITGDPGL